MTGAIRRYSFPNMQRFNPPNNDNGNPFHFGVKTTRFTPFWYVFGEPEAHIFILIEITIEDFYLYLHRKRKEHDKQSTHQANPFAGNPQVSPRTGALCGRRAQIGRRFAFHHETHLHRCHSILDRKPPGGTKLRGM